MAALRSWPSMLERWWPEQEGQWLLGLGEGGAAARGCYGEGGAAAQQLLWWRRRNGVAAAVEEGWRTVAARTRSLTTVG
jgi:hypothetical protein